MTALAARVRAVHEALDTAAMPHAFGGAIALAYCTGDPRPTADLDVNVFVERTEARQVIDALPRGFRVRPRDLGALERDGQVRLRWEATPVDLFLDTDDFHREVAARVRMVPFEGIDIPVLDCVSLAVFKAFFSRGKDWVDIANMIAFGLDVPSVVQWLQALLGPDDEVTKRMAEFLP